MLLWLPFKHTGHRETVTDGGCFEWQAFFLLLANWAEAIYRLPLRALPISVATSAHAPNFFWKPRFQNKRGTGSPVKLFSWRWFKIQHFPTVSNRRTQLTMATPPWWYGSGTMVGTTISRRQTPQRTDKTSWSEGNFFLRALTLISWCGYNSSDRW